LVLWCLTEELRALMQWSARPEKGAPARLWRGGRRRQDLLARAARRLPRPQLERLLVNAARTDLMIKGIRPGRAWDELGLMAAGLAGVHLPLAQ
jgi:DNA polymerase-3 subunit delta